MNKKYVQNSFPLGTISLISILVVLVFATTINTNTMEADAAQKKCIIGMITPGENPCVPSQAENPKIVPAPACAFKHFCDDINRN